MRLRRRQVYAIRDALHQAEFLIPRQDRSQIAEYERDLVATACVALWECDVARVLSCLRRLTKAHVDRRAAWMNVLNLALDTFQSKNEPLAA